MMARPFSHVAVVNRGEAAVRFMRAARTWRRERREPLWVIALYTNTDAAAPFVRMASSAVCLGEALVPGPEGRLRSAYLDHQRVLDLALRAGADAVWPGWGFVAESPEFADACAERGLVFLGPPASAMRRLGDKVAAKRLAEKAGVPVAPWSGEPVADPEAAAAVAERIGYPLLLKASAGGGGRGIRRVDAPAELAAAFRAATSEAAAAFGDPAVFVESFVPVARHVEVQVLADAHGTVWALGTRDCSMQRRHQKVLEEAPAPGLAPAVERALCDAAVALARASGYVGAGTAEFLLLPDGETFHFLEMNTRLQVEHTVTEEIYGMDLVGAQIDIARGVPLPAGGPPAPRGAAIEARINAEDPDEGFAPRAGRLARFTAPQGPGVRVDSGYEAGSLVPSVFDSMLAKVIARGADRRQALGRLETALRDTVVALDSGLTNRALLLELVRETPFRDGALSTRWLDGYLGTRPAPAARPHLEVALAAAALGDYRRMRRGHVANFLEEAQRGLPRTVPEPGPVTLHYLVDRRPVEVEVATVALEELRMRSGRWQGLVRAQSTGERTMVLELAGHRYSIQRVATAEEVHVEVETVAHHFRRRSDGRVRAPLPASVAQVHVQPGEWVAAGARLVTLEVMKMESAVMAPVAGTVRAVPVRPAVQVAAGEVLVEIEESGSEVAADLEAIALPEPDASAVELDPLRVVEARLLGFDVSAEEAAAAAAAIAADPAPPRGRLLQLLQATMVQEQLFIRGPFDDARNEARETSLEQLAWFAHHRHLDTDRLSARFVRRLRRFLDLHGIKEADGDPRVAPALLRLFQARRSPEAGALTLALLHALARSRPDTAAAGERPADHRAIFEELANEAVQRNDLALATAAWNLIHRWFDEPERRADQQQLGVEAASLFADFVDATSPPARAELESRLLALPLAPLAGALAGAEGRRQPDVALALLLERIYGSAEHDELPLLLGRFARRRVWVARGKAVVGLWLPAAADLAEALAGLPPELEADLLLGSAPDLSTFGAAAARLRARWTALWWEGGELRISTWVPAAAAMREDEIIRDSHPASPLAHELRRFAAFSLERQPGPPGILLLRASAPGDERLLALAEVERFAPVVEGDVVRVPAFEQVFLDAAQALRAALRSAGPRPPVLNRITLAIRPPVDLSREQVQALAERLAPSIYDLNLEKVSLLGTFALGKGHAPRELWVEWKDPIALGLRFGIVLPRRRPVAVSTAYQQSVIAARRRRLFYPYELINWLSAGEGAGRARGRFEELDLDASGRRLASVAGRPFGENQAAVVLGRITTWTQRFPDGLTRLLVIGDPTREMGSLGEPECRRLVAAIDLAEAEGLPIEWVALSAGARIAFDSGTENLDWTAAVLRRLVEFTARGGIVHVVVDGPCVGAQSYWNAEATMLMHCKGALVMTPRGYMVLTGKRALEVSGSVAAPTNEAIGGLDIMEPNGQAQYTAPDLFGAYQLLLRHYDYTHVAPGQPLARRVATADPLERDVTTHPYRGPGGFATVGEIFTDAGNPGRKKPFAIREVLGAVVDQDAPPLERWSRLAGGETAVVLHGQLGGQPVCLIGVESQPVARKGARPVDGPASWTSGTLFPQSSRKVARAIRAASGLVPVVVLANLSGFDGSPESLRERQLEYGAEIGKAVVEFAGPLLFCVVARYHGGAYVVFSRRLSERLDAVALQGSYASVIGGGAAAAVVFPRLIVERAQADTRVVAARAALTGAAVGERRAAQEAYETALAAAEADAQAALGREFDLVHSVSRALEVGSLGAILPARELRPALCARLAEAVEAYSRGSAPRNRPAAS